MAKPARAPGPGLNKRPVTPGAKPPKVPIKYNKNRRNAGILKQPAPVGQNPGISCLDWTHIVSGDSRIATPTPCCDQGVRIHDVIIIIPIHTFLTPIHTFLTPGNGELNKVLGMEAAVYVHAGCLRKFLDEVPDEYDVVKERVAQITGLFLEE